MSCQVIFKVCYVCLTLNGQWTCDLSKPASLHNTLERIERLGLTGISKSYFCDKRTKQTLQFKNCKATEQDNMSWK